MDMIIRKSSFPQFLRKLDESYDVYGPTRMGGGTASYSYPTFGKIGEGRPLVTDYHVTMTTLKSHFVPDNRAIYEWEYNGDKVKVEPVELGWGRPRAFVAVHPCDIAALERLDRVFLGDKCIDSDYEDKRKNSVIIGLTCEECGGSCFCNVSGSGPDSATGFDLLLTNIGDSYYVRSGSPLGDRLVADPNFEEVTEEHKEARARSIAAIKAALPAIPDGAEIARIIEQEDVSDALRSLADHCFTCGACNMVCPTCHCFTFVDRVDSEKTRGSRWLIWDACHYAKFSTMAGNVNPRSDKTSRFHHRIFDKFWYDWDRYGEIFCVGCGRCLEFCPGHIDIREGIRAIQGVHNE